MNTSARMLTLLACLIWLMPSPALSQSDASLHALFAPLTLENMPPNRTASGAPSADYWSNRTDYFIAVRLDTERHRISGEVHITYTNNSPDELAFLWMLLEQNLFREDSRGALAAPPGGGRFTGRGIAQGYEIEKVEIIHNGQRYEPDFTILDTRMRIDLAEPLAGNGAQLEVRVTYAFGIPEYGADRMGRIELRNGWVYTIAQWYPNMAVYDEKNGWNTRPYLGAGEFYRNFGDIEFHVTAPWNYILAGSGTLINPEEVLTARQISRLEQARASDETVMILAQNEIGRPDTRPVQRGELTWKFRMENTRDVAWAASRGFIWDAAGIEMPSGRRVLAQSFYPVESAGPQMWGRSTEFVQASVHHYSHMWYEYPWDNMINVAGVVGGMEYPGLAFCGYNRGGASLWGVTDHEIGHNWFPMIVSTNERKWFWLDEGLTTFIGHLSTQAFNNGEFPTWIRSMQQFVPQLTNPNMEPIMTHADRIHPQHLGFVSYFKPAMGLLMLRDYVLGEEVFDFAFRTYIQRWAYKHPSPIDFFRTMNDASGENLDWFWRGWFYENRQIDLSVDMVEDFVDSHDNFEGAFITISSPGDLVMPVVMRITYADGSDEILRFPVEIWHRSREWTFLHRTEKRIDHIRLDPFNQLPDVNRRNNEWLRSEQRREP